MMTTFGIWLPALSFGLCMFFTPLIRRIAISQDWIAIPTADRWHKTPTALMGGIAIFSAIAIPLLFIADPATVFHHFLRENGVSNLPSFSATVLIGCILLFSLGLVDDFYNIKPQTKLIGQIIVALFVVFLGFRLHWFHSLTIDTMATIFWIVGITNAFNLIDNMDGLCTGVAFVAAISLALLFYNGQNMFEPFIVSLIFAGALLAFLVFNFNPAKIFMGDCGSLVIGFSLAFLSLYYSGTQTIGSMETYVAPILILLVPILDTSLVMIIRVLSGRKASTGGRDHTSHRLVLMGFSEKKAVLFLYAVGAVSGLSANFVARNDSLTSPAVIIPIFIAIVLMGVYLSQLRVYPEKEFSALRNQRFTPILLDLTYKRQLLLVILDLIVIAFAYYLSYRLRFSGSDFVFYFQIFLKSLPAIIGCKLLVFFLFGIYRGMWSFLSTNDVFIYIRSSLIATLVSITVVTFIYRFQDFSKGIFIIDFILTTGFLLAIRGSFRLFLETKNRRTLSGPRVLIYGAGRAGELLIREIINNKQLSVNPIGFIDDDDLKKGKRIQGYPILGGFKDIQQLLDRLQPDGIVISFNDQNGRNGNTHQAVEKFCREHRLFLKKFHIYLQSVELRSKNAA